MKKSAESLHNVKTPTNHRADNSNQRAWEQALWLAAIFYLCFRLQQPTIDHTRNRLELSDSFRLRFRRAYDCPYNSHFRF